MWGVVGTRLRSYLLVLLNFRYIYVYIYILTVDDYI